MNKSRLTVSDWRTSLAITFVAIVGVGADAVAAPPGQAGERSEPRAKTKLIGFSQIDELPPLPIDTEGDVEGQPTGVSVPIFRVISDEELARGGTASTGSATAIVFRQSYDSGYGRFMTSVSGNFIANLLHLGNSFPMNGGQITRYDTMIYNSVSSPGGNAAATISLWDGDPLGFVDTGSTGIPTQIAGTICTFSDMELAGQGAFCVDGFCEGGFLAGSACTSDMDCGLCPGGTGGTDDACPGLFFLSCDLGGKVTIPSRNIWMVIEWTAGCRMGWRLSLFEPPEVAAVGEENFCGDTCPNSPSPCVDMIYERYDAFSQTDRPLGTCCEDNSIVCDHTDCQADGTGCECGHPTSCLQGVATDDHAFCYGAPDYYASFVASIYAETDTTITLVPVEVVHEDGSPVAGAAIAGNAVSIPSTDTPAEIYLDVMVTGWGGEGNTTLLKVWQVTIDSSTYANGVGAALTSPVHECTSNADCGGLGGRCEVDGVWAGFCAPAWQNCGADKPYNNICLDLPACNLATPNYQCASISFNYLTDPGKPSYGMSVAIRVPSGAEGTYNVGFLPAPSTFLIDTTNLAVPLIGYVPAKITIGCLPPGSGACCLPDGSCQQDLWPQDCRALDGAPRGMGSTCLGDGSGNGVDDVCEFDVPCEDCGPGSHWVDDCPEGWDYMPARVEAGIDFDGDCIADTSVVLDGPVAVHRCLGDPTDHSIATELVSMTATGGGITLRAGAFSGEGGVVGPTFGEIDEKYDAGLADSFFDVFFELQSDALAGPVYNHDPVRIEATIDCVAPQVTYVHQDDCVALYDSPVPGEGEVVAWLVEASHETFPPYCGDGEMNQVDEECDGTDDAACPGECRSNCTCPAAIPTVSHWGLVALTLLLLAGGKIYFERRRLIGMVLGERGSTP